MPKIDIDKDRLKEDLSIDISDEDLEKEISFLGTDLEEFGEVIEVEIFPDRPDLLSYEGFLRNVKAFLDDNTGFNSYSARSSDYVVEVSDELDDIRPCTSCMVVKGLDLDEDDVADIIQVQEKLHVTYGRNRKKCAIGIYPFQDLSFPIQYGVESRDDVRFTPLGRDSVMSLDEICDEVEAGKKYGHLLDGFDTVPVFEDADGNILSVPPIINSASVGEVQEGVDALFIECSGFDQDVLDNAMNILGSFFADKGGDVYEVTVSYADTSVTTPSFAVDELVVSHEYIATKMGFDLSSDDIVQSLDRMNYGVEADGDQYEVQVPSYRVDVFNEIDVVEDVAIGYKFYNIEVDMESSFTIGGLQDMSVFEDKVRDILVGHGLVETYSYNLVDKEMQQHLFSDDDIVSTVNSVSEQYDSLRFRVLVSLLKNLRSNKNNRYPQSLFEIGHVFERSSDETVGVDEYSRVGIVVAGLEKKGFTKVRGILQDILASFDQEWTVDRDDYSFLLEGRSASVRVDDTLVGFVGDIDPEVLSLYELEVPVSVVELDLQELFDIVY